MRHLRHRASIIRGGPVIECTRRNWRRRTLWGTMGVMPDVNSDVNAATTPQRHQVVVIGSGFGGLFATKALRRADVDVTLISEDHPPPLPAAALPGGDRHPVRGRDRAGDPRDPAPRRRTRACCSARSPTSTSTRRTVTSDVLAPTTVTPYDSLIVAAGAGQSYFGNDQFAEFAPGHEEHRRRARAARPDLRRLRARRARGRPAASDVDELADLRRRRRRRRPASRWPARSPSSPTARCKRDFRAIDTAHGARDRARRRGRRRCCRTFGTKLGARRSDAAGEARRRGVARREGHRRRRARPRPSRTRTAAQRASRRVTKIVGRRRAGQPARQDPGRADRRRARPRPAASRSTPTCTLPGHPEVFVVGDMIDAQRPTRAWPRWRCRGRSTPPRRSSGRLAARPPQKPFHYFDKGSMATISRFNAVANDRQAALQRLHRLAAVARRPPPLPDRLQEPGDARCCTGRSRSSANDRSERTATEQQIFARAALQKLPGGTTELVSEPGAFSRPPRRARGAGRRGGPADRRRRARSLTGRLG